MQKTVVVTGASSGIGEALVYQFVRSGFNVVFAARSVDKLKEVEQKCALIANHYLSVVCDVSIETDCQKLIQLSVEKFGGIDVLINNAGISMRAVFNDCDLDVLRKVMDINFWGAVYCTKFALPYLLQSKGSLIGISSIAGIKGLPARTGYSASKFALNGFLESLRIENLKKGLHVLIACPGYTESNIRKTALNSSGSSQTESPLPETKLMSAEQVAKAIYKAVDKKQSYLYLTSEGKLLLWLNKFFPLLMDKIVFNKVSKEKDSPFQ
jgi:dehydrogenase/reductase SDR family member 7B